VELFADFPPPSSWEKVQSVPEDLKKNLSVHRDIVHLCNATQQLYLDMPSWEHLPMEER
jgi:hypothetical protein